MPYVSRKEEESADRSLRKTYARISSARQQESRTSGFRAAIASGTSDHILIIPTKALEDTVFNRNPDPGSGYSALHKSSRKPKPYYGSNRGYWDTLLTMGYGETTIGELRAKSGDQRASSSIEQAYMDKLIEFDEFQVGRALGMP